MAKTVALAEQNTSTGVQQFKQGPARLVEFLKEVRAEMRKVHTPTRDEVQATTIIVIITVFMFAAYFWLVDNIIGRAIEALLHKLIAK